MSARLRIPVGAVFEQALISDLTSSESGSRRGNSGPY